jgi:hypothetical protein
MTVMLVFMTGQSSIADVSNWKPKTLSFLIKKHELLEFRCFSAALRTRKAGLSPVNKGFHMGTFRTGKFFRLVSLSPAGESLLAEAFALRTVDGQTGRFPGAPYRQLLLISARIARKLSSLACSCEIM